MNKQIIKVSGLDLGEGTNLLSIESLERLESIQKEGEFILETPDSFFLLEKNLAYRVIKPKATPKILFADFVEINIDHLSMKVSVSKETLFRFAVENSLPVFETKSEWILPSDITMIALKKGEKHEAV